MCCEEKASLPMTCGAAFKRETASAVSRLKVARPPKAGGLSFCAAKPRKNLRRARTKEMKLFDFSETACRCGFMMELCEAKQPNYSIYERFFCFKLKWESHSPTGAPYLPRVCDLGGAYAPLKSHIGGRPCSDRCKNRWAGRLGGSRRRKDTRARFRLAGCS